MVVLLFLVSFDFVFFFITPANIQQLLCQFSERLNTWVRQFARKSLIPETPTSLFRFSVVKHYGPERCNLSSSILAPDCIHTYGMRSKFSWPLSQISVR